LCGLDIDLDNENKRISKAYIPELGLSNKAAQLMSNEEKKELEIRGVNGVDWTYAPLEGQLADHTIWPEVKKLFSHNNDVTCIDTSADGILIASASKARDAKSASIIIWSAVGMIPLEDLPGHESTVVRVKFSPDSKFLASGGKDRSLCVYRRGDDNKFISCKCIKEAHKRIIWDCCWSPDSRFLVSASRDGSCRIWSLVAHESDLNHVDLVLVHSFSPFSGESVTSVDMTSIDGQFVLACGSEHGNLSLWSIDQAGSSTACIHVVSDKFSHGSTISRIQWKQSSSGHQLATCGEDHTVRIFTLRVGHI
jgi:elongator complex protein 2